MTDFEDIVRGRYSCRAYSAEVPSEEQIKAVLEDARLAPSACNRQPWRFLVIGPDDSEGRKALLDSYQRDWLAPAQTFIVVCGVPSEAWVRPYDGKSHLDIDVAIATEHICLSATAHGLGTCWVCHFDPEKLVKGLSLPDEFVPMVIVPIGYAAEGSKVPVKQRKSLDEIVLNR